MSLPTIFTKYYTRSGLILNKPSPLGKLLWPGSVQTLPATPALSGIISTVTGITSKVYNFTTRGAYKVTKDIDYKVPCPNTVDLPLQTLNRQVDPLEVIISDLEITNPMTSVETGYDTGEYNGTKVHLGIKKEEKVILGEDSISSWSDLNDWVPDQNKEYFFKVTGTQRTPNSTTIISLSDNYIGKDLYIKNKIWEVSNITALWQRIYDTKETDLGWYYVGSSPYKEITSENGQYISALRYEDRDDGLYYIRNISYDYVPYAKEQAWKEYYSLGLKSSSTYRTSLRITLTLDALLYYKIRLLTNINIVNTNIANTYKNDHGFPVSVKSITIDSNTMLVTLYCDNKVSPFELANPINMTLDAAHIVSFFGDVPTCYWPEEYSDYKEFTSKIEDKYDVTTGEVIAVGDSSEDATYTVVTGA